MAIKWWLGAVIVLVLIAEWLWRPGRKRNEEPLQSIVIFLQNPKPLNVQMLASLLSDATGRSVRAISVDHKPEEKDDKRPVGDMVTGASPHFIAYVGGTTFAIHNLSDPYMEDPIRASESFPELRLRKAIREHKAWLSMDVIGHVAATPEQYRVVARVLAKLIDANCLALYHPPLNQFVPCTPDEVVASLNADDPINAVFRESTATPVIPVGDDPRLSAAEAEAKRRFPEFESAFKKRDGEGFMIKTLITANGNSEHIWVEVDRIVAGTIEGRLGNHPVDLGELKLGSKVEIEISRVEDWVFARAGAPIGMFTDPVIRQITKERAGKK